MALPATAGSNCWTIAEDQIADYLSQCSAFLTWLGEASSAAAKAGNMYMDSLPRQAEHWERAVWDTLFPHVVLGTPGDLAGAFRFSPAATGHQFNATGVVEVVFRDQLEEVTGETNQERSFKNSVGDILEELTDKDLLVGDIVVVDYGRNPEDEHEDLGVVHNCVVNIPWGPPSSGGGES